MAERYTTREGGKTVSKVFPSRVPLGDFEASETISSSRLVNVHNDSGPKIRYADASLGYEANGFVIAGATAGSTTTVYQFGAMTGLGGLTPGEERFLSTNGTTTATAPTSGLYQNVGRPSATDTLQFQPGPFITR